MKTIKEYIQKKHIGQPMYFSNMPKEAVSKDETMKSLLHLQLLLKAENTHFKPFHHEEDHRYMYVFSLIGDYYDSLDKLNADFKDHKKILKTVFSVIKDRNATFYNTIGHIPLCFAIQEYLYGSGVDVVDKEKLMNELTVAGLQAIQMGTANIVNVIINNLHDMDITTQVILKLYGENETDS